MNPEEYKKRIAALGFDTDASWYKWVDIDRTTHFRHMQGSRRIPNTLCRIIEWLEQGKLDNPND